MLKVLTVGDGDLTLSLALARAYGNTIDLTASVLDSRDSIVASFPDVPIGALAECGVPILFNVDATQLHQTYSENYWDLILFHHPHLGLSSLAVNEAEHASRHFALLAHYMYSAKRCSKLVHVCLCGTQPETWRLSEAASLQGLSLVRKVGTAAPFSQVWTDQEWEVQPCQPDFAAPRRYRNGKLGSRHFLGKYGYRHRRTAGELYNGASSDMNVAGSFHFVFQHDHQSMDDNTLLLRSQTTDSLVRCTICGTHFASQKRLEEHLVAPAKPQEAQQRNLESKAILEIPTTLADTKKVATPPATHLGASNIQRSSGDLVVSDEYDGKRLRWFLQRTKGLSKRHAEVAIQSESILVDGVKVLDSGRILKTGMIVSTLESSQATSNGSDQGIEIVHRHSPDLLVVWKPSGMRTKGNFQGTLEHAVSEQEGMTFESLSKLDTSCPGLCVMAARLSHSPSFGHPVAVRHRLVAMLHGRVPVEWFPHKVDSVVIQRKWNKRKRQQQDTEETLVTSELLPPTTTESIRIIPMQVAGRSHGNHSAQQQNEESELLLSTVQIETENPSSASICQWLRQAGFPVVGDLHCRREYLGLKRAIRNRIKEKLCLGCYQVEWQDGSNIVRIPSTDPVIPDKLSAFYWETHFGSAERDSCNQGGV